MESFLGLMKRAAMMLLFFTLLTGVAYPALVTVLAQTIFPGSANGSLIVRDGQVIGSELIGQSFKSPEYFWSRPSATTPLPYNAASSGASNLGPLNPKLGAAISGRITELRRSSPEQSAPIPVDLVTASASGLDPHISPAGAEWQAGRVARTRGLDLAVVLKLIHERTEDRYMGCLGQPRVNVLQLNLALDELAKSRKNDVSGK